MSRRSARIPIDCFDDPVFVFDERGRIREWNRSALEASGYSETELESMPVDRILGGAETSTVVDTIEQCSDPTDPVRLESTFVTADGERRPFDCTVTGLADDSDARAGMVVARDASERTELEDQLRETRHFIDQLFHRVPTALYVKDTDARHVRMSDYDIAPSDAIGRTDLEIYDRELAEETYADDMQVIRTGEPILNKEEYNPTDQEWTLTSKVPWYDEDGEINGLIGVSRLITEKKEYERAIERQNERLDNFASIVSHDLRNPLNAAVGYLELVANDCDSEHLPQVERSLERMDALIEDLLELARQGRSIDERTTVSLASIADDCWDSVRASSASLRVDSDGTLEADPERLKQVFENLFRNAVEHGSTSPRSQTPEDAVEHGSTSDADGSADAIEHGGADVTVTVGRTADGFYVEDDGPGVPPGDRDQLFDHGYTTSDDGTGFGLTIVEEIVDAHGWEIDVCEGSDGGLRFEIVGTGTE
ncbi:PAS domain-containing sensor histidine kinase [Natrialba swarupiae]|uniref:histidine kinase n=1 Tax=Natrialba swarupiae TaxID=2448032 RepID=A0A5D5AS74_9EURY|nr:PAS domain-containing protein [Natrialba swarupiae]TYT63893.1 PAS domain-containing protein [Natrialba swarupiae]